MKRLHLICNAHIDPVWQWEWEEGAAAALSTFRAAAEFCEEFEGFIFNHNEAILYKWIEEYEPQLFEKIQRLVSEGKWHIMCGWYLQPDCNMPSGESLVRQVLRGKKYFKEKFGAEPTTAVNFDSFGHTRGLVQILSKSGYNSYIFMRPDQKGFTLPGADFIWVGYDGAEILAHRISGGYNSKLGHADKKILDWLNKNQGTPLGMLPWGVGNHGGGPSRNDLKNIALLMQANGQYEIIHSTPEKYFKELADSEAYLPRVDKSLNPKFVGCYTSQIQIKQKHRQIENELYMTEKMLSGAAIQGLMDYPENELLEATYDLLTSEFHDILPGSSVQNAEEASLRLINHGLEILSRLKARAFFALSSGQEKAKENEYPILIYNPHPYKVKGIFECEFMLADQNWKEEFSLPVIYQNGRYIPSQAEKEQSNINLDWRKRVVFAAELEPSQMNRFDCMIKIITKKPGSVLREENGVISFHTEELDVVINCITGLIDRYAVHGVEILESSSFKPLVIMDSDDSWKMNADSFREIEGEFILMTREEGTAFSGIHTALLDSVRVIEDGEVRTVVEAVFKYNNSYICMNYKLPKQGTEMEIQVRVLWNEKSKMLKLSIPTTMADGQYLGQVAYGVEELPCNGTEAVSQKWVAIKEDTCNKALTIINKGIYGSDYADGEVRLTLLRSPGYCAHPIMDRPIMVQDRYLPRIDQGERMFAFWINAGEVDKVMETVDRQALIHNERPFALSFYPSGEGKTPVCMVELEGNTVQMSAFKRAENSKDDYILRIFEPTGKACVTALNFPISGAKHKVKLNPFEIKTLRVNGRTFSVTEVGLMETQDF